MPFRFPLETLLRFRRSVERQHELLLQEANLHVNLVQHRIEQVHHSMIDLAAREIMELEKGMGAAELHFDAACRSILLQHEHELRKELKAVEERRDACLQGYRHAHQERDVIDTLRDHHLEAYRREESRREQRGLDEMFLLRREFLRRG